MAVASDAVIDEQGAELGDVMRTRRQCRPSRPLSAGDVPRPHDDGRMSVLARQMANRDALKRQVFRESYNVRKSQRLENSRAKLCVPGIARHHFDDAPGD